MRYRDAKDLRSGDQVKRKIDGAFLIVKEKEVFGQYKIVLLHCVDLDNEGVALYNNEID